MQAGILKKKKKKKKNCRFNKCQFLIITSTHRTCARREKERGERHRKKEKRMNQVKSPKVNKPTH